MDVKTVSTWMGLAVLLGGLIYAADNRFALAGGVAAQFNAQAIAQQELFNENRLARLESRLEELRARRAAGYAYPDDSETEVYLLAEIERARNYEEMLRQQKAQLK